MSKPSLQELLQQKATIDRQIEQVRQAERNQVLGEIARMMAEHDLTMDDLRGVLPAAKAVTGSPTAGRKVPAKYRDPETNQTWSGRGLPPKWLKAHLDAGRTLPEFAIRP